MEQRAVGVRHVPVQSRGLAAAPLDIPIGSTLLVGIDFSEGCERALLRAVALAEQHQAQIALVHVFEWADPNHRSEPESHAELEAKQAPLRAAVLAQANATLGHVSRLCSALVGDRAPATVHVVIGDPACGILSAAERVDTSLIVLGDHGRRCVQRGPVGSTAQRIRDSSAVPVLLVSERAAS